ncbi:MAG: hypothetical protein R3264_10160, partial [Anaerolineae bacterium]|nr:hypothetical protein [Anaerolineae bacterium]
MAKKSWASYPDDYRAREMKLLTNWISAGESGSVVGLAGCGRSHLLSFLCHRPDVLKKYLLAKTAPVVPVLVDLNNLPTNDISTLYRTILRAFFQNREYFAPDLEEAIAESYLDNRGAQDPFLSQSAFHDLLA